MNRLSNRQVFRLSALGLAAALAVNHIKPAQAATTWLGGADSSWSNGANWSGGVAPSFIDVLIDAGNTKASAVNLDVAATVTSLTIDAGDSLTSNGPILTLAGSAINNNGTLTLNSSEIKFSTDVALTGTGQTVLNGGYIGATNPDSTLTIGAGHTLRGRGNLMSYFDYTIVNKGRILADSYLSNFSNFVNNTNGLIQVADGAHFDNPYSRVSGGFVEGLDTGGATISAGFFEDLTLTGKLRVSGSTFTGTITNNGTLTVDSGSSIRLNADLTLAGTGQTVLNGGDIDSGDYYRKTLTIDSGHTLKGYGKLGFGESSKLGNGHSIVNKGTILADNTAGNPLYFVGDSLNNSNGLIQVADGASFYLPGGFLSGGTIEGLGAGGATIAGGHSIASGTYSDLTLTGKLQTKGERIAFGGTIINNGILTLNTRLLAMRGSLTLAGTGQTVLNGGTIQNSTGGLNTLTIGAGHTLNGYGKLGSAYLGYIDDKTTRIINNGTIRADNTAGNVLQVYSPDFKNRGTVQVDAGALAWFDGPNLVQDGASAKTIVDGTLYLTQIERQGDQFELRAGQLDLQAGQLSGKGTIVGNVANTGGQINPGASPGKLIIFGNYSQAPGGSLAIEIDGTDPGLSYDWLAIAGTASLAGDLYLDIGYVPADGTSFTFLTSLLGVTGTFDHIYAKGWNVLTTYGSNSVSVTLTAAVPEPESFLLLLLGMGLLRATRGGLGQRKA